MGTGHAVLVSRAEVREPFAVINADDYYGRDSIAGLAHLSRRPDESALVGYLLRNTLSEHGSVARGVCSCDASMFLAKVVERTAIHREGSGGWFVDDWGTRHTLTGDELVSMNHNTKFTEGFQNTRVDYDRIPVKPVLDGEPIYEDHPVSFRAAELGHSIASDVRRPLYWNLFSGAFGRTYGHHSVWQMWQQGRDPINNPLMPWREAIEQPGAAQMKYGRRLIESRPFLTRIPDDELIVVDRVPTSGPGSGRYRFVATRDLDGTYAMIYAPVGRPFKVRMGMLGGTRLTAWWFDPRTGAAARVGEFSNQGEREFIPPAPGEMLDWVAGAGRRGPAVPSRPDSRSGKEGDNRVAAYGQRRISLLVSGADGSSPARDNSWEIGQG